MENNTNINFDKFQVNAIYASQAGRLILSSIKNGSFYFNFCYKDGRHKYDCEYSLDYTYDTSLKNDNTKLSEVSISILTKLTSELETLTKLRDDLDAGKVSVEQLITKLGYFGYSDNPVRDFALKWFSLNNTIQFFKSLRLIKVLDKDPGFDKEHESDKVLTRKISGLKTKIRNAENAIEQYKKQIASYNTRYSLKKKMSILD